MMEEVRTPQQGLCAVCLHARRIASDRGSVFVMCARSRTDARFPRYPPLPVLSCAGFDRIVSSMPTIAPARLKPGVTADQLPDPVAFAASAGSDALIKGTALVLWDAKVPAEPGPRKKRDAIDTD